MNPVTRQPLTLAIDTARDRLQLALALPDGTRDGEIRDLPRGHAEILFDAIGALLARNARAYADLERVAVLSGPGSFTGLRIGLSAARGLGLALSVPVLGIPTLLALSLTREGPSEIILDARRGEAYRQAFIAPGRPAGAPELVDLAHALAVAARTEPDESMVAVDALARFAQSADPGDFPPVPTYIRAADAKPQTKGKVAHR